MWYVFRCCLSFCYKFALFQTNLDSFFLHFFHPAICTGGCLNGGECVLPETCNCSTGWTGQNCELGNSYAIVMCDLSVCIIYISVIVSALHICVLVVPVYIHAINITNEHHHCLFIDLGVVFPLPPSLSPLVSCFSFLL